MASSELLDKIRFNYYGDGYYRNYTNSISINGWLTNKPIVKKLDNGKRMIIFAIFQVNKTGYKSFLCKSFSETVINALLDTKNVSLINCLGMLANTPKSRFAIQIEEISISHEYLDIPLEKEYTKE